jgi:hypothetical protein
MFIKEQWSAWTVFSSAQPEITPHGEREARLQAFGSFLLPRQARAGRLGGFLLPDLLLQRQ